MTDHIHEECGVFGIWDTTQNEVAGSIYYGLMALQHRGQESAGIAVCKTDAEKGNLCLHKQMGVVSEVFNEETLSKLHGNIGVGHVRYSTTGASNIENAQPIAFSYQKGTLALVHNGNIVNTDSIREELFAQGHVLRGSTDSEILACLIARERAFSPSIEEAAKKAARKLIGGFAVILMSPQKLVAMRDPLGLKPMCLGKRGEHCYIIASESCALTSVDAQFIRDIRPGEILTISKDGIESDTTLCDGPQAHCIFEYIYFARLDSKIDNVSVYNARIRGGAALAKAHPVEADIVSGVPESGLAAAQGYAIESGIPFAQVFHKNSYIGRTFIKPTQKERESSVHMKLSVLEDVARGKRIVLIDDSIVRGTTMAGLIRMLRNAGALEVHVRISSPPFTHPCYYGTDVPDNSQLIANRYSIEEIRQRLGADTLGYMKAEDIPQMTGDLPLCTACFTGKYPTLVP